MSFLTILSFIFKMTFFLRLICLIYVKYQDLQPVEITRQNLCWTPIGDLVAACKTAFSPLFDHLSVAQLSLYKVIDGPALNLKDHFYYVNSGLTPKTALILQVNEEADQGKS